jgi:hypothetical protein
MLYLPYLPALEEMEAVQSAIRLLDSYKYGGLGMTLENLQRLSRNYGSSPLLPETSSKL